MKGLVLFGPLHWMILGALTLSCVLAAWAGRRFKDHAGLTKFNKGFGIFTLLMFFWGVYDETMRLDFVQAIPLELCDMAWVVCAYVMYFGGVKAQALIYYWGFTLTIQGILTPDPTVEVWSPRFIIYWVCHPSIVIVAAYQTFGLGFRPDWQSFRFVFTRTLALLPVIMGLNALLGTNYMFINRKPTGPSALDYLGPWPWYVLVEVGLALVIWALMTLPWVGFSKTDPVAEKSV